jgi:cyclopropane-fatty-acyl-phospholipid synthase
VVAEGLRVSAGLMLAEAGLVPDAAVRAGIRKLLAERLAEEERLHRDPAAADRFVAMLRASPIAVETRAANDQHYEVPPAFFELALGRRLKYSSALWDGGVRDLDEAEERMLAVTCERARLGDGMDVLELGCGWGSLTLWMAERYPRSRITAVSNSRPQREHIEAKAARLGLGNVRVVTADMNVFEAEGRFDRVVSVEMFEHMRNYDLLLAKVARWLAPGGLLFVHVFSHRRYAYAFETEGAHNWMGRHFFTGGIMPSDDLFDRFDRDLVVCERTLVDGTNYARTAEAWLANLDARRDHALRVLRPVHGRDTALWFRRWRMFFMACAELFAAGGGGEWHVSHHLFEPRATAAGRKSR